VWDHVSDVDVSGEVVMAAVVQRWGALGHTYRVARANELVNINRDHALLVLHDRHLRHLMRLHVLCACPYRPLVAHLGSFCDKMTWLMVEGNLMEGW
jgi:hypothetical protein